MIPLMLVPNTSQNKTLQYIRPPHANLIGISKRKIISSNADAAENGKQ